MTRSAPPVRTLRTPAPLPVALGLALLLATAGCSDGPAMATYQADDWTESFMQVDFTRFFHVHVPERNELGPAAPLVLAFHGVGQTGETFRQVSGLDAAADAHGFIVVYLEAAMGAWDVFGNLGGLGLDELGYVREVIERVDQRHVIDRRKIVAVGLSNGGVMSQQLACKLADRIAGFVSVAASMSRLMAEGCAPSRPVSARYILGTVDAFFPVAGNSVLLSVDEAIDFWAGVNGCGGSRHTTAVPDTADDGTTVFLSFYRLCDRGTRVILDSIAGGGHAWPGSVVPAPASFGPTSYDISANDEIARFLRGLPRN